MHFNVRAGASCHAERQWRRQPPRRRRRGSRLKTRVGRRLLRQRRALIHWNRDAWSVMPSRCHRRSAIVCSASARCRRQAVDHRLVLQPRRLEQSKPADRALGWSAVDDQSGSAVRLERHTFAVARCRRPVFRRRRSSRRRFGLC
jgi:hypothetical protein